MLLNRPPATGRHSRMILLRAMRPVFGGEPLPIVSAFPRVTLTSKYQTSLAFANTSESKSSGTKSVSARSSF